jgi:DNA topoisomerase-1
MNTGSLKSIGLTYVSDTEPGILRKRQGKGFCYRLPDGSLLKDRLEKQRIRLLGLPPAYENVWICLDDKGHLQATGYDSRGRKQYRYHADWQLFRSELKYHQLGDFAKALPRIRRRVARDLAGGSEHRDGVLAALVTLLDATHLRIGNKAYARENRTYGATTLLKRHLSLDGDRIELSFVAKGGQKVKHSLRHPHLQRILEEIADLPGRALFSWREEDGTLKSVDSGRLNAYLGEISGSEISAKTFRTWGGSLAAYSFAFQTVKQGALPSIKGLCAAAAEALHNTPAVCRTSYIHPAIIAIAEDPALTAAVQYSGSAAATWLAGLRADENRMFAFLDKAGV